MHQRSRSVMQNRRTKLNWYRNSIEFSATSIFCSDRKLIWLKLKLKLDIVLFKIYFITIITTFANNFYTPANYFIFNKT